MKRLWTLAVAVFLATTVGASASVTHTVTLKGGNTCTTALVGTLTLFNDTSVGVTNNVISGWSENDTCGKILGVGLQGTTVIANGTTENHLVIAYASNKDPKGAVRLLTLQFPLAQSGKWALSTTTNGKAISTVTNGTYTYK